MTIVNRSQHVKRVGSELERILRKLRSAIADSTSMTDANYVNHFARVCYVHDIWRGRLDILPEPAVDDQLDNESRNGGIYKE